MLSKYEDGLKFEEERLCAAIQCLQTDDLICPICKQYVSISIISVLHIHAVSLHEESITLMFCV